MKHSELPYRKSIALGDHYGRFKGCRTVVTNDENNWIVAICPSEQKEFKEGEANAQFIVKACNNYYQVKAALEYVALRLASGDSMGNSPQVVDHALSQLDKDGE